MGKLSILILISFSLALAAAAADGDAKFYELKRGNFSVRFTNLGAAIVSVILPDRCGDLADVVLGFERPEEYQNNTRNFGAVVGRVANRIKGARFTLNGKTYQLIPNDGENLIHGGIKGFAKVFWQVKRLKSGLNPWIIFGYDSPDNDQGFPGKLAVTVNYTLIEDYSLSITMTAKTREKATIVNLAQHSYWNLAGVGNGNILEHEVQIYGSKITKLDKELIPTGEIISVKGTPYDFLSPRTVGSRINMLPNGYDINYVLNDDASGNNKLRRTAVVYHKMSGRKMELWTNQPGVQFYTANHLKNVVGKDGIVYAPHEALCLETQGFPDAVNHPNFPSTILKPWGVYKHFMLFRFSTADPVGE